MQQIADWLEKLGMSEYAQRFAENKIDVSVLRHLTDQDLKDIGVPLGHRRRAEGPKDIAERRQVTVMFVALLLLPAAHRQRVLSNHRPNGVAEGCARKTSCRHKNCS